MQGWNAYGSGYIKEQESPRNVRASSGERIRDMREGDYRLRRLPASSAGEAMMQHCSSLPRALPNKPLPQAICGFIKLFESNLRKKSPHAGSRLGHHDALCGKRVMDFEANRAPRAKLDYGGVALRVDHIADLPCRSRLVRRRSVVREVLGSNPRYGMGSLKVYWNSAVDNFRRKNPGRPLGKLQFGKLFTESWTQADTPKNAMSGFRASGIFPFNPQRWLLLNNIQTTSTSLATVRSLIPAPKIIRNKQETRHSLNVKSTLVTRQLFSKGVERNADQPSTAPVHKLRSLARDSNPEHPAPQMAGAPNDCATGGRRDLSEKCKINPRLLSLPVGRSPATFISRRPQITTTSRASPRQPREGKGTDKGRALGWMDSPDGIQGRRANCLLTFPLWKEGPWREGDRMKYYTPLLVRHIMCGQNYISTGIVRHDSHVRKSGGDPLSRSPPSRPRKSNKVRLGGRLAAKNNLIGATTHPGTRTALTMEIVYWKEREGMSITPQSKSEALYMVKEFGSLTKRLWNGGEMKWQVFHEKLRDTVAIMRISPAFTCQRGHGGVAVTILVSHQGEPGAIPGNRSLDFRMWESYRTVRLFGGSPVSYALSFQRCSIHQSPSLTLKTLLHRIYLHVTTEKICWKKVSAELLATNFLTTLWTSLTHGRTPYVKHVKRISGLATEGHSHAPAGSRGQSSGG
ncbi:hypothetical protein PR048_024702 [Dryococelus australis]|uniref:Ribosomal protein S3 n=1 Tax=Dryococelus australis TaxID=614101 RepID=A0ABQ9GPC2_9NEOP|nr:hypothetical protein PR048_024702 [Dryococelus australis]